MAASSIQTKKGRTRVPGVYSETIPVGVPLASPGIKSLVLVGDCEGGEPGVMHKLTRPDQARARFRSGDLLDACLMAFDPARDEGIPGRPTQVYAYKLNPAKAATATLGNLSGPVMRLDARDWGDFTNRIGYDVAPGTNRGTKFVVQLDGKVESADDIGGTAAFTARYDTAGEASSMLLVKNDTGLRLSYAAPLAAAPVTAAAPGGAVKVVSASAYDVGQRVTVYGLTAGNVPASETLTLNGASAVTGSTVWTAVTAVAIDAATAGVISVKDASDDTVIATVAATLTNGVTGQVNVISANAADVGTITLYGTSAAGNQISEVLTLNGTTAVVSTLAYTRLVAARLTVAAAGQVQVRQQADNAVGFQLAAGTLTAGINVGKHRYLPSKLAFDGTITAQLGAAPAGAPFVVIRGTKRNGDAAAEYLAVTENEVTTANDWVAISQVELGMLEAASTLTLSGTAAQSPVAKRPLLRDAVAFLAGLPGFEAVSLVDAAFKVADLDSASKQIRSAVAVSFLADGYALGAWINANSSLVKSTLLAGFTGAPSATPARTYLQGGENGTTTNAHWRAAISAAKKLLDVVIVPLSGTASVHNLWVGHLREMDGVDERQMWVGLDDSLTKDQVISAINALNNRQTCSVAEKAVVYDDNGLQVTKPSWAVATLCAAAQCGSPLATPLTDKRLNLIDTVAHSSWNPVDDIEEMIGAGLVVVQGSTVVRSVSSYREDDNPFFNEMSTVECLDNSAKMWRRNLRPKIGDKNFDGARSTVKTLSIAELERQVRDGEIKSFNVDSVEIDDIGDGFDGAAEVEPIEPINFIRLKAFAMRLSTRIR